MGQTFMQGVNVRPYSDFNVDFATNNKDLTWFMC